MLEKFSLLIGKWKGNGTVCFPTIQTVKYTEELEFRLMGDDESILFEQRTWHIDELKTDRKGLPFIGNRDLSFLIRTAHWNY